MKVEVVKLANGKLRGFGQENDRLYKKFRKQVKGMEPGEMFTLSWVRERNPAHHRKLFSLTTYIAENSDVYNNKDKALTALKVVAGHCEFVPDPKGGRLIAVPKSISFESMGQDEFESFYQNAVQGAIDHILPHMTKVDLEVALRHISEF